MSDWWHLWSFLHVIIVSQHLTTESSSGNFCEKDERNYWCGCTISKLSNWAVVRWCSGPTLWILHRKNQIFMCVCRKFVTGAHGAPLIFDGAREKGDASTPRLVAIFSCDSNWMFYYLNLKGNAFPRLQTINVIRIKSLCQTMHSGFKKKLLGSKQNDWYTINIV